MRARLVWFATGALAATLWMLAGQIVDFRGQPKKPTRYILVEQAAPARSVTQAVGGLPVQLPERNLGVLLMLRCKTGEFETTNGDDPLSVTSVKIDSISADALDCILRDSEPSLHVFAGYDRLGSLAPMNM